MISSEDKGREIWCNRNAQKSSISQVYDGIRCLERRLSHCLESVTVNRWANDV